jgi:prophage tail gpP-like protein
MEMASSVVLTGELNEQDLADFVASMVQSIVSGLEGRFLEGDLLDNSAIFDVASYKGKSAKEIAEYGEDEFMMILKHFNQPADKHRWFDTESVGCE